jgi:hypothetical protein
MTHATAATNLHTYTIGDNHQLANGRESRRGLMRHRRALLSLLQLPPGRPVERRQTHSYNSRSHHPFFLRQLLWLAFAVQQGPTWLPSPPLSHTHRAPLQLPQLVEGRHQGLRHRLGPTSTPGW